MNTEQEFFPSLLGSQELELARLEQLEREYPKVPPYQPFPVVEEHYPRVAQVIHQLWGTPEMDAFFNRMLIDDRGNRAGFPIEVVRALLALSEQHQQAFRHPTSNDVWVGNDPSVARFQKR